MSTTNIHHADLNPFVKGALYILGGILALLLLVQLFLSFFADDYAADYIKDQVRKSSNSTYTITFDDLSLNVFSGSATIENLRIEADTIAFAPRTTPSSPPPKSLYQGTVGLVDVSGVNFVSAAWGEELHIGSVRITRPDITQFRNHRELQQDSSSRFSSLDSSLYAAFSKRYNALEVGEFAILNANGRSVQRTDTLSSLADFNLNLTDIRVDSASAASGRLFITDNFSVTSGPFSKKMSDSLNTLSYSNLAVSSDDQSVVIDSLHLNPRYPKLEYSRKNGRKKDRIDLLVPKLSVQGIDIHRMIDSTRFYAQYVEIEDVRFEDFLNKSAPPGPIQQKELPFIAFRDMKQPVKIDSLRIKNGYIAYSEYLSKAPQAGTVTFEQLDASFYDLSNYAEDIEQGITTQLDVQTRVFGAGLLNVHFDFPMDTQSGFHTIEGELGAMSITEFNEMLEYIAFIRIDQGSLNSLRFNMTLNEERSNGDVIMNYEDLKISVLDAASMEQRGVLENIKTFVANNFVVNKNNTPGKGMKAGRVGFQRLNHKSIFNYWWKSLLSGIKNTVK